jgi:hypothetical protein
MTVQLFLLENSAMPLVFPGAKKPLSLYLMGLYLCLKIPVITTIGTG